LYNLGIGQQGNTTNKDGEDKEYNIHEEIPPDAELPEDFNPDYYLEDLDDDEEQENPVPSLLTFYKSTCKSHPGLYKVQYGQYYKDSIYCIDTNCEIPFNYYF
jgi:hypothetical protein